ncbi:reverse transcriptase domain-containing protein [Tanacetum coccineum]
MVGGKPFNTEHKLNEFKHIEPVKQKKRGLSLERNEAIFKEVEELTKANILREFKYEMWVSNPVMVKKDDERWKLCVDFTDVNKACPKDCYPLPEVDQKRLPFGQENAGVTYQKLINKVFNKQIGRNLEVYIDDIVIKSDPVEDMLVDIQETFDRLQAIHMKLNPRKCSFGIEKGPFPRHLITKQGIKANPSEVKAISDLKLPKTVEEIQSLNKKLAALSRFLSKGADKALPFLKILKNCTNKKMV